MICSIFFTASFLIGHLVNCLCFSKNQTIFLNIFTGVITMWGLLELLLVPMTLLNVSFHTLSFAYGTLLAIGCLGSLLFWRKIQEIFLDFFKNRKHYIAWTTIIAVVIIIFQLCYLYKNTYYEGDDAYYVNQATEALQRDIIYGINPENGIDEVPFSIHYCLSLWSMFYALLGNWFHISPTIIAHTVIPFLTIPFAYLVYLLMGQLLFEKDTEAQGYFLIFVSVMHMFLPNIHTLAGSYLLLAPWMGKAILASISLPAVLYIMLRLTQKNHCKGDWILLFLLALSSCLHSSMAIAFVPTLACSLGLLWAIRIKKPSFFLKTIISCIPCFALGACALIIRIIQIFR